MHLSGQLTIGRKSGLKSKEVHEKFWKNWQLHIQKFYASFEAKISSKASFETDETSNCEKFKKFSSPYTEEQVGWSKSRTCHRILNQKCQNWGNLKKFDEETQTCHKQTQAKGQKWGNLKKFDK